MNATRSSENPAPTATTPAVTIGGAALCNTEADHAISEGLATMLAMTYTMTGKNAILHTNPMSAGAKTLRDSRNENLNPNAPIATGATVLPTSSNMS